MGADRKLQFRSLTRMYLYIIQLLKLRRCTLSLFTVVLAVLWLLHSKAQAWGSLSSQVRITWGGRHVFFPVIRSHGTFSGAGLDRWAEAPLTLSVSPGGEPPQESGGVCVTSTNKHRAENCTIGLFGALLTQQEYIYRSNTLSLIDATLYFLKSSFKAAPQGITW